MAAYTATFAVKTNQAQKIIEVFAAEDHELSNKRASYTIKSTDSQVEIIATAVDAVAFRAIINAISKILAIFEKMQTV